MTRPAWNRVQQGKNLSFGTDELSVMLWTSLYFSKGGAFSTAREELSSTSRGAFNMCTSIPSNIHAIRDITAHTSPTCTRSFALSMASHSMHHTHQHTQHPFAHGHLHLGWPPTACTTHTSAYGSPHKVCPTPHCPRQTNTNTLH